MGIHAIFRVLDKVLHRPVEIAVVSGPFARISCFQALMSAFWSSPILVDHLKKAR